jgi:hypothetical protein
MSTRTNIYTVHIVVWDIIRDDRIFFTLFNIAKGRNFSMKNHGFQTALKRKNKDWLARNQDNVSEWDDMSISGLLLQ